MPQTTELEARLLRAALDAALAAIPRAAYLVESETLELKAANPAAQSLAAQYPDGARTLLRAALAKSPTVPATVVPVGGDLTRRWLLVLFEAPREPSLSALPAIGDWRLTQRQQQVLAAAARGLSNREIALELHCSESTVEKHMTAIFAKARVDSRAALLAAVHNRHFPRSDPGSTHQTT